MTVLIENMIQRQDLCIRYLAVENPSIIYAFASQNQPPASTQITGLIEKLRIEQLPVSAIFLINADSSVFLKSLNPMSPDDYLSVNSPVTIEGNRTRKRFGGFEITQSGFYYRLVYPIFTDQDYIGLIGVDIDAGIFLDQLNPHLHDTGNGLEHSQTDIAFVFPSTPVIPQGDADTAYKTIGNHILFSHKNSLFQGLSDHINLDEKIQYIPLEKTDQVLIRGIDIKDFTGQKIAWSFFIEPVIPFVAISETFFTIVAFSFCFFVAAFILFYMNLGKLFKRTETLNHSLQQGYKELEHRLEERSAKLQQEIDARSQAETALQKERKTLSTILESNHQGIAFIDKSGQYRYVNSYFTEITGYTIEDIPTKTKWFETVYPDEDYRKKVVAVWEKDCLHQGMAKTRMFKIKCKNGQSKLIEFRANFLKEETIFTFIDITLRKKSEKALQDSEKTLKAIFEANPDPVVVYDINGHPIYLNLAFTDFFGWTLDELRGKRIPFVPKDQEMLAQEKIKNIYETGNPAKFETKRLTKNGVAFDILLSAAVIKDYPLRYTGMVVNLRDITKLKQAEQEKIKAQQIAGEQKKLTLVGQIAGKMAHDFNNILGAIMGNAELSLMECTDTEIKKNLELIFEQTLRGKNLTKNLVAFAKDQEPKQEFFKISEKIDLVLNLLKRDLEGIELIKEVNNDLPELLADPGMIEHALVNLIQNSIHATGKVEFPKIFFRAACYDDDICFEIEDNGCGIPKFHLKNIFEPSFTLKGSKDITGSYKSGIKGTGYGMSNVKKYIEQHNGSIIVESEFGSGTKIIISLPVIKKELTSKEKADIENKNFHSKKRILLVEDEPEISTVQFNILTQAPCFHTVDIADTGQAAIDLYERNLYDLVSLDYILPGNINGMDVYHHIRETDKTIPILFISGNIEFLESIKELKQKDIKIDHLSKPCRNKDYISGMNQLFDKQ